MVIVPLEALTKFICSLCVVFEYPAQSDIERGFFTCSASPANSCSLGLLIE